METWIIGIVAAVILITIIVFISRKNKKISVETKEMDIINLSDVIQYFKRKEIITKLNENKNYIAVAIKEFHDDKYTIVCAIFDKKSNNASPIFKMKSTKIDQDLIDTFGNKDMILFS